MSTVKLFYLYALNENEDQQRIACSLLDIHLDWIPHLNVPASFNDQIHAKNGTFVGISIGG